MARRKMTRAEKAGRLLARAIFEIAQLMYQENTKKNFLKGLLGYLKEKVNV